MNANTSDSVSVGKIVNCLAFCFLLFCPLLCHTLVDTHFHATMEQLKRLHIIDDDIFLYQCSIHKWSVWFFDQHCDCCSRVRNGQYGLNVRNMEYIWCKRIWICSCYCCCYTPSTNSLSLSQYARIYSNKWKTITKINTHCVYCLSVSVCLFVCLYFTKIWIWQMW